ncbi:MAG: hypothetical protein KME15_16000 [Drouetiella hepatica Uher 2000/2452]|jgi:hypothetical protein|uniref:Uncharacterized protein n=1 Tax=Drouetiella hepatica Uher 2000/2452 TaxID=904376 RepID=A0A951QCS6_9CYAN|nr:hypothetical protein [Drouetiella hepatica Uher 2000/2452]
MNLPVVIEIAIGLVFIYLTLSLLTSEIQELIAILLQWRAEHLRKSVENLLTGENIDDPLHQKFVDELYDSPLLRSLNQEAKGLFANAFRQITYSLSRLYHSTTGTRNIFGQQKSAPSYIPAETFSVALLQKLNIEQLSQKVSELTARKFSEERLLLLRNILNDLRNSLGDNALLENEFRHLQNCLQESMDDFISGRATLSSNIEQVSEQLIQFINNTETLLEQDHPCQEIIRKRLPYVKQMILRRQPEPTVTEVLRLIFDKNMSEKSMGASRSSLKASPCLNKIIDSLDRESPELIKQVSDLPEHLKQNLLSLAEQSRLKAESLEAEVRQLETEVANWFDQSMERASGVYKRNAKGVALLIGLLVALLINADTLHMMSRLSKDSLLRETIAQAANQTVQTATVPNNLPPEQAADASGAKLESVKNSVNKALDEIPLPIGWDTVNTQQQEIADRQWSIPFLQRAIGWGVTGVALSMGASFWYDLLQRVIQVRGTGGRPNDR